MTENISVKNYTNNVEYEKLPSDCISILNNEYCICKSSIDLNQNSNLQYTQFKETLYLYNIKTGNKEKVIECEDGHNTIKHIIGDGRVFWMEHYIKERTEFRKNGKSSNIILKRRK